MSNFYDLLGISKTASKEEIKSAYRKKAMEHHPDRNGNSKESEEMFKQIKKAYETLSNDSSRAFYDQHGSEPNQQNHSRHNPFHGNPFGDMFADFFRQTHSQQRQQSGRKSGEDVQFTLNLSLHDCLKGMSLNAEVPTQVDCKVCNGTGSEDKKPLESCSACSGSGMFIRQQGNSIFQQTCPTCQGSGKTNPNPCKVCSGNGFTVHNEVYTLTISAIKQ